MEGRRRSLLDATRKKNFLRNSFCSNSNSEENPITITREDYLAILKKENEDWKAARKETTKNTSHGIVIGKADLFDLCPEDEALLKSRLDYIAILEKARLYTKRVTLANKLVEDTKKSAIMRLQDATERIDASVTKILAESDEKCTICNHEFCTKDIHPLIGNAAEMIANFDNLQLNE